MVLDANESERLWRMLGRLNEQVAQCLDVSTAASLKVERLERTMVAKSEYAGRVGAKKGARYQAALVSAAIGLMSVIGTYFASRTVQPVPQVQR